MGLFGPSRRDVWAKIANELDGHFNRGGIFGKDNLVLDYQNWRIVMDTFTRSSGDSNNNSGSTYTRLRAPFLSKTDFRLEIYRESIFSPVGKWFGMQDIELGDEFFDEQFIVKSNDEQKIKYLLDDEGLKNFLSYQPKMLLKIRHEKGFLFKSGHPQGVDELYFECRGVLKNEEIIFGLFALFKAVLDRLVVVDFAHEGNPNYIPA